MTTPIEPRRHPTAAARPPRGTGPWVAALLGLACLQAPAATLSGNFNDASNTALVGSDLGAPSFVDVFAVANNVALYDLLVPVAGAVTIISSGFAEGGADPYFTLFAGAGNSANVIASNYTQAFSTGGDFSYAATLAAGTYRISLGLFANMSLAENLGSGTLADGFIGLGEPTSLGDGHYRLQVTTPVPELSTAWLSALGLTTLLLLTARSRRN
nr:DVUA0089 family protein [uncultured Roseateles sp.]